MVTFAKWSKPPHVGEWTLDVDSRQLPTVLIAWRAGVEVARLPFRHIDDELITEVAIQSGMTDGESAQICNQMAMKLASHKVEWDAAGS